MKNTIAERIADFLKNYPPFNLLTKKELKSISEEVEVLYLEKGKFISMLSQNHLPTFILSTKELLNSPCKKMRCLIRRILTDWHSRHAYFESESLLRGLFFAAMISELFDEYLSMSEINQGN